MFCGVCHKLIQQQRLCVVIPRIFRRCASSLDIPIPRLKDMTNQQSGVRFVVDSMNRYVRVAPWGPRPDKSLISVQPLTKFELETEDIPSTNKRKLGKLEVTADQFLRVGQVLRSYGVDNEEIEKNPGIFAVRPNDLEDYLELFRECGWELFTADMIVYCWVLLAKIPAKVVVNSDSFSVPRSILRNLLTELKIDDAAQQDVLNVVTESTAAYLTLADLRGIAIREYVKTLYPDPADLQTVLGHISKKTGPWRPVKSVERLFHYLINEFGIPPKKILKYTSILGKPDRAYKDLLERFPVFHGLDLRVLSMHYPNVICPTVERLERLEVVLKKFAITGFQLSRNLNIVNFAAETTERRLLAIQQDPELWKFKDETDFLLLVTQYNDAVRRLSFLRSMKVQDFALNLLICSQRRFHEALTRGAFEKEKDKSVSVQHLLPVATFLGLPADKVKKMMREQLKMPFQPYTAKNNADMQRVMDCLHDNGITKQHFLNCMSICLYPSRVVEKYMAEVMGDPASVARKEQPNFLHYVLYAIEKQTNFAGPQAWGCADAGVLQDEIAEESAHERLIGIRGLLSQNIAARLAEIEASGDADQSREDSKKEAWFE